MLVLGIDTCCMPATSAVYDGEKIGWRSYS